MNFRRSVLNLSNLLSQQFKRQCSVNEYKVSDPKKLQFIKEKQKYFQKTEQFPVWNRYKTDRFLLSATVLLIGGGLALSVVMLYELSYVKHFKGEN